MLERHPVTITLVPHMNKSLAYFKKFFLSRGSHRDGDYKPTSVLK